MTHKHLSSGIQKKYLKSTFILLFFALLLSMIGVWSYMHHTLKNNIIEKYEFADEKMGILLDNLYTKSKEVTAEAILNETIQKSLNAEELTDNEKNAVGKYFSYLDLDSIQDYCYMDNKGNIYTRSYSYVDAFDIKNTVFQSTQKQSGSLQKIHSLTEKKIPCSSPDMFILWTIQVNRELLF